ncbi:tRNA (adenosine(37)-N6)-threonylcarbamoyltransferase complex transferase subunit TsaD [Candidatus Parcubacteria bacterium]|jgi:N6-L-threonylcarbamoyladenine synthase|nr:MAG: tRNA (adenosine(37)-N6)-threonylcarbamoyltransferase complex transferase subunit TsaD [Candidatus Parcubacteria bacterium]
MNILGIETSCDDTSVAVIKAEARKLRVVSCVTASQILIHQKTAGVVPEVAAREHAATIMPTLVAALKKAGLELKNISALAVTAGPGLATALLVGVETARALNFATGIPLFGVNHIAGHLASCWLGEKAPKLPALALVVSGGHTELLWLVKNPKNLGWLTIRLIGKTRDDAAGEAFDKTAKLLGLPYPGGPEIAKLAKKGRPVIDLPRPMLNGDNFEFSFAGLKTSVMYYLRNKPRLNFQTKANLAASVQQAIVETLIGKTLKAAEKLKPQSVLLAGGVAANEKLRDNLQNALTKNGFELSLAPHAYTTDNGAMIAAAGYFQYLNQQRSSWQTLKINPVWELGK